MVRIVIIVALLFVSAQARALVIPVSCAAMVVGNVTVNPNGTGLRGNFTSTVGGPPPTLAAALAACGEHHFNWYQIVTNWGLPPGVPVPPGLPAPGTPLVDPPAGGLGDQWADNLPGYFDETPPPAGVPMCPQPPGTKCHNPVFDLATNTHANRLDYFDFPGGFAFVDFKTFLASMNADGTIHSLHAEFLWHWDPVNNVTLLRVDEPASLALFLLALTVLRASSQCVTARRRQRLEIDG